MQNVAFVTYNAVGRGLPSGWHDGPDGRRALVLQNTKGEGSLSGGPIGRDRRVEEIGILWGELQKALTELDHVVIYVGTRGSERAIELASELPPAKVTFVGCDCGLPYKEAMIQLAGLAEARRFLCECGGHRTMEALYERFMETGTLPTVEPD